MSAVKPTWSGRLLAASPVPEGLFEIAAEPWVADALCAQTDPEMFFPEKGGSTKEAKRICSDCPVVAECLEYALREGERIGIWGGRSSRERSRMLRAAS